MLRHRFCCRRKVIAKADLRSRSILISGKTCSSFGVTRFKQNENEDEDESPAFPARSFNS